MCKINITSRLVLGVLFVLLAFGWKANTAQTQSTGDKPVEQVRKNIQVLKGLPDSQLFLLMNFVGDSLGVNCDYCHVKGEKNPQTGDAGTPSGVVAKLERDIGKVLEDQNLREWISDHGGEPMHMTQTEFGRFVLRESENASQILKAAAIRSQ